MSIHEASAAMRPCVETSRPLHELLDMRAEESPDALALVFLADGTSDERRWTYRGLSDRARALAARLTAAGAGGKPVLLLHEPGNEFVAALFACWHAGAIAVPAHPPRGARHRERLASIIRDCGATLALANGPLRGIDEIRVIHGQGEDDGLPGHLPTPPDDSPCLIQYTSGSTSEPKGVVLRHRHLRSHYQSLSAVYGTDYSPVLSWLPHFHDMGLVLKILFAFESGSPLIHFSPARFILRPLSWLQAISRYRAEMSGAPNFAYEACLRTIRDEDLAGLDLSCWKAAPCGAERIRPETLERFAKRFETCGFRADAFRPGYGLAEATLTVTAHRPGDEVSEFHHPETGRIASCGLPVPGVNVRIADPATGADLPDSQTGEIRVSGPSVADGYFRNGSGVEAFGGELSTGDLGFLLNGRLFVTGRIKDLIILDGVNHAPEDIEHAAMQADARIRAAAAIAEPADGRECASLLVEVAGKPDACSDVCRAIRRAVSDALGVPLHRVAIVREGLLPRTTSGKIRRGECATRLADGELPVRHDDLADRTAETDEASGLLPTVLAAVDEITGRTGAKATDDLTGSGIGSLDATRLANRLRVATGRSVSISDVFASASFAELAATIQQRPEAPIREDFAAPASEGALTHAQERMWFLHQMDPQSAAYHVFGVLELRGPLNKERLASAFQTVVSRHDILASRHGIEDGRPVVWHAAADPPKLQMRNATDEQSRQILRAFACRPFALDSEPPIRSLLVETAEDRHLFAVCAHHIAADGWSMRLLAHEIAECYSKPDAPLPPAPSYLQAAPTLRAHVDSGAFDSQLTYWTRHLADHPGIIPLPTDFPRPPVVRSEGELAEREIPSELRLAVAEFAKSRRVTPFMVHLTALLLLLRGHGSGDDLVVAIPVANRNRADTESLIGSLVNTLPFRQRIDAAGSVSALVNDVRAATLEMQENQDIPFESIITALQPERSSDHPPLAQVMFDHQEIPIHESWAGGLHCRHYPSHRGAAQFDLSLFLTSFLDHETLSFEYRSDLFRPETAERLLDRLLRLLERICESPDASCASLPVATDREIEWLESVGRGPVRPSFPRQSAIDRIVARVGRHPQRPAVVSGGETRTYQELLDAAGSTAAALRSNGIRQGDRVAVLLERDADLPSTLLGIWLAGAAYVPLDRANPPERLRRILTDQGDIPVLITPSLADHLPDGQRTIAVTDEFRNQPPDGHDHIAAPDEPAYVIYTSGSTGAPKGVVVSHGALANFLSSMAEMPGFTEADRMLAITTVSFDISTLELFLPLVCGGSVEVVNSTETRDGHALRMRIESSGATVIQATPATWRMLIDGGWQGDPSLKLLCGGEALDPQLASNLSDRGCQLWNLYGPTETTVWSTIWQVPLHPAAVRIGIPIANTGVHVVSAEGKPLPPGVTGELWISGAGLAEGYWNNQGKTRERFVELATGTGSIRAYRTGDLARWRPEGTLECLGRSDGQIKIRGFRVELGEIDAALADHPQVAQARSALRGAHGAERIVAWVTATDETPDLVALRGYLAGRLPSYMLPSDIGVIDSFPLNSSGKVDVSTLPDPHAPARKAAGPSSETERRLIEIWRELLDRRAVHPEDDWFHIGGHSLLALRMFARIHKDLGAKLPFSALLEHPTPRQLATAIENSKRP